MGQKGATYFVTFRLGDSIPQEKLDYLRRLRDHWMQTHPPPRSLQDWDDYNRSVLKYEEHWLDEGYGECYFRSRDLTESLEETLFHFQEERYFLSCWTIMPNHCHLVIRPFEDWSLEKVLQGMKGVSSRNTNMALNRRGSLWLDESYDRIVRDEEHLWRVVQYIGRNPIKANLVHEKWRRWVHPDWEAVGWRFVDS